MKKPVQPKRTRKNAAITKMLAEVDAYLAADSVKRLAAAQALIDKMTPRQLAAAKRKYGISP